MSRNVGDQEYNGGKKYRQKGTLCGPNKRHGSRLSWKELSKLVR
jgi:hypothetical protein